MKVYEIMAKLDAVSDIIDTLERSTSDRLAVGHFEGNTSVSVKTLVEFLEDYQDKLSNLEVKE